VVSQVAYTVNGQLVNPEGQPVKRSKAGLERDAEVVFVPMTPHYATSLVHSAGPSVPDPSPGEVAERAMAAITKREAELPADTPDHVRLAITIEESQRVREEMIEERRAQLEDDQAAAEGGDEAAAARLQAAATTEQGAPSTGPSGGSRARSTAPKP
jgi:hypothetical protein